MYNHMHDTCMAFLLCGFGCGFARSPLTGIFCGKCHTPTLKNIQTITSLTHTLNFWHLIDIEHFLYRGMGISHNIQEEWCSFLKCPITTPNIFSFGRVKYLSVSQSYLPPPPFPLPPHDYCILLKSDFCK